MGPSTELVTHDPNSDSDDTELLGVGAMMLPPRYLPMFMMSAPSKSLKVILLVRDQEENNKEVVLKAVEDDLSKKLLHKEANFYNKKLVKEEEGCLEWNWTPNILNREQVLKEDFKDGLHYLVFEKVGNSLQTWHEEEKLSITAQQLSRIAVETLKILEWVHGFGIIHRNIHPGHLLITSKEDFKLQLIDFSYASKYLRSSGEHIKLEKYNPRNSHRAYCTGNFKGRTFSRREDVEMLALMLIDMKLPNLPWRSGSVVEGPREMKHKFMKEHRFNMIKRPGKMEKALSKLPGVFQHFLEYSRNLQFDERPDYARWINEFGALL